jgi:AcrR family transcriptional regulator
MEKRTRAPEQTRRAIIDAAIAEFADKGLSGARVDEIAARTATTKRMIYYYFGGKEQLYATVLEEMYGGIRDAEAALDIEHLPPLEALKRLAETTFDYHAAHPECVRMVAVENIHSARHLALLPAIMTRNAGVLSVMQALLDRGVAEGVFRPGLNALDLHMLINGHSFHRVSNRHTLARLFGQDLTEPAVIARQRTMLAEVVERYVRADP